MSEKQKDQKTPPALFLRPFPPKLHQRMRVEATKREITLKRAVELACEEWLRRKAK